MTLENVPKVMMTDDELPPVNNTQQVYIPPVVSTPYIFESGGLGAALQPQPYIESIKPLMAQPDLAQPTLVTNPEEADKAMPSVAPEEVKKEVKEEDILPPVPEPKKVKVSTLDKITNYIYKLIFK
jgi:hypothetical protein